MPEQFQIETRSGFGLAAILARKGVAPEAVAGALNLPAVDGPRWSGDEALALIGTGPGTWLAFSDDQPHAHVSLRESLGPHAAVVDQSGAYVITRLSGPAARTVLQRGAPIDLHPTSFGPGCAAVTVIAHIGVILRQLDDAPTYDVAVFRSYAAAFRRWLDAAVTAL